MLLGIGTNLGDRAANVRAALRGLADVVAVDAVSDVYETEPFGYADQPVFWNLVVRITGAPEPEPLIAALKELERRIGRAPTFRMGPRAIDIDVLLYGSRIVSSPNLEIPHAGMLQRRFVLRPLLDVSPGAAHPRTGELLRDRLAVLGDDGSVRRLGSAAGILQLDRVRG